MTTSRAASHEGKPRVRPVRWLTAGLVCLVLGLGAAQGNPAAASHGLWQTPLDPETPAETRYGAAVEALIATFERTSGEALVPGELRRAGLKLYTESGPGLSTPVELVVAVIDALERRGFARHEVFLVGLNTHRLQATGFLPRPGREGYAFAEQPVYVLESGRFYDPVWYYDSPLPSRFDPILAPRELPVTQSEWSEEDRKSFLATPLFLDADFWINLPMFSDHPVVGINGALTNATLWNASNTSRFFRSNAAAPAAVAEMSAIPELRQTWAFTLASLERYQFIGGPRFNSLYTRTEPLLWLAADPVQMDAHLLHRLNQHRVETGFRPVSDTIRTLEFAESLGVGSRTLVDPVPVHVPTPPPRD